MGRGQAGMGQGQAIGGRPCRLRPNGFQGLRHQQDCALTPGSTGRSVLRLKHPWAELLRGLRTGQGGSLFLADLRSAF